MRFYWRNYFRSRLFGPRFLNPDYFRSKPFLNRRLKGPGLYRPNRRGFSYLTTLSKPFVVFMVLLFFITAFFIILQIESKLKPTILVIAQARSKQIAIEEVNRVIKENIANNIEYADLITIHKDNNDRIVLLQPNTTKINKLQAETALEVNKAFKNLAFNKASIPIGQITGSYLLATLGPNIPVRMAPIGTIDVKRIDEFEAAGINQTRHLLSFKISATVRIYLPLLEDDIDVNTEVLIADNILVGDVPKTYLNLDLSK